MYPVMTVDWREEHSDTISLDVWQPMLYAEDMLQFISLVAFHEWSKWTLLLPFFFVETLTHFYGSVAHTNMNP